MGASVSLASSRLSIRPGDTVICDVGITNTGSDPDRFSIQVVGDLAEWSWSTPSTLAIDAGSQATVRIACQPPLAPTTQPGPRTLDVVVTASREPQAPVVVTRPVQIERAAAMVVTLEPSTGRGRRSSRHRVIVRNSGNVALHAAIAVEPTDRDLDLRVVPGRLSVEPGAEGIGDVVARARRVRWSRDTTPHRFEVRIDPDEGPPSQAGGALDQVGLIAGRAPWMAAGLVVLVALVVLGTSVVASPRRHPVAAAGAPSCPGADHLAHDANGQMRPDVVEPDNYAFLFVKDRCAPVRFNPCQPVHYELGTDGPTPAQLSDLHSAIAMVSQATGIDLVSDGTFADAAGMARLDESAKAAGRWPPVRIEWRHLGSGTAQNETAGGGRPTVVDGVIVTGVIFFNLDVNLGHGVAVPGGFGPGVTWGRIMLHELGHLVGLGHVSSPDEVMHEPLTDPSSAPTSAYGVGDITGLRMLGRSAGCEAVPAVRALPSPRG